MTEWSTADIPDLSDRTAVVTGANSGIGLETTRELAAAGASVIMACRNRGRGDAAKATLLADDRSGKLNSALLTVEQLELSEPDSIKSFVALLEKRETKIDLLINNAGVMACPPELTSSGVERQWATNHLGHFALTGLLLDSVVDGGRVVSVSSVAAEGGDLTRSIRTDLDGYSRFQVYSDTKLANQVFAVELNHRLAASGSSTISVAAHPGISNTNLGSGIGIPLVASAVKIASRFLIQPPADGALPTLRAATDPAVEGGQYYGPSGRRQHRGSPKQIPLVSGTAKRSLGRELWNRSMELSGVRYLSGD